MDNLTAQNDELLVLQSICTENELIFDSSELPCGRYSTNVNLAHPFYVVCNFRDCSDEKKIQIEYLPPLTLSFELPISYPSETCPAFLLSCNWLSSENLSKVCRQLEQLWIEGNGEVILYRWIQFLKEETLEFLEITDSLDITELSRYNLKAELLQSTAAGKEINPLPCQKDSIQSTPCEDFQKLSLSSSSSKLVSQGSDEHVKQTKALCTVIPDIKPSISGGDGTKDRRAFLDLADGRNLLTHLQEYDKFKKTQRFQDSWHTCNICFKEKIGSDFVVFRVCNHHYCRECIQFYFEHQIKEGNVNLLNCPEMKCTSQADGTFVKQLVSEDLFNKYDSLLLSQTLESMNDVAYCPRLMCQCPLLLEPMDRMGTCPACSYVFCPFCKMAYHGIAPCNFKSEEKQKICEDYQTASAEDKSFMEKRYGRRALQSLVENTLSEKWVSTYSKNCPRCRASIEKTEGCNKMTCFRCGTYFCWLCMKRLNPASPYFHFNDVTSECFGQLLPDQYMDDEYDYEPGEFLNF